MDQVTAGCCDYREARRFKMRAWLAGHPSLRGPLCSVAAGGTSLRWASNQRERESERLAQTQGDAASCPDSTPPYRAPTPPPTISKVGQGLWGYRANHACMSCCYDQVTCWTKGSAGREKASSTWQLTLGYPGAGVCTPTLISQHATTVHACLLGREDGRVADEEKARGSSSRSTAEDLGGRHGHGRWGGHAIRKPRKTLVAPVTYHHTLIKDPYVNRIL